MYQVNGLVVTANGGHAKGFPLVARVWVCVCVYVHINVWMTVCMFLGIYVALL